MGAIVAATQRVAQMAQPVMADIVARIRGSPVVHADETGWREDGHNGYVWTFSTPTERYFLRQGRAKAVVDEALGTEFEGVLVSDFYAGCHHYDGPKQRCWAHLLRDICDLRALYPEDGSLTRWADAVQQLYRQAKAFTHPAEQQRRAAQLALERRLLALCRPSWMTRRRPRPGCADAWRTTSRNSSSSWLILRRRRTTTPPNAACAMW